MKLMLSFVLSVFCLSTFANSNNLYKGVFDARAISEDKAEVFFYPNKKNIDVTYMIRIFSSSSSATEFVNGNNLQIDYRGILRYVIPYLERATRYVIKVDAIDDQTGKIFNSLATRSFSTFKNKVADFYGVNSATKVDSSSVMVSFFQALKDNSSILPTSSNPKIYEIIILDQALLTPASLYDSTLGPHDGRFVFRYPFKEGVNQLLVEGLPIFTDFYVGMRTIHEGSIDDFSKPWLKSELNTKYVEVSTRN